MGPKRKAAATKAAASKAAAPASPEWESMKVADLREACIQKGLDSKGTKAQLVDRLNQGDEGGVTPAKLQKQDSAGTKLKKAFEELKKETVSTKKFKPDPAITTPGLQVYEQYSCMLNQTNVGANNNKFYVIQALTNSKGNFFIFNKWGRVGEPGTNKLASFPVADAAIADFKKKFREKTQNAWEDKDNFVKKAGKYELLDMAGDDSEEDETDNTATNSVTIVKTSTSPYAKCSLDKYTQEFIKMIFDNDMFNDQMKKMELDVNKMPLGKLSKPQIAKGFDALVELENAIKANKSNSVLEQLTSKFYTLIPHNFGRSRPPVINDEDTVRRKKDVLTVLSDIELAQSMQKDEPKSTKVLHPLDEKYGLLHCDIEYLDPKEKEHKLILNYTKMTNDRLKVLHVWRMNREGEGLRFKVHDTINNRRLLWHGTNVAVVAAILKSGLRIMPHSGGRVGKGIYFASENSKSAGYVGYNNSQEGVMFLNEVALGKEYHITDDDHTLVKAPPGYDCVIARGCTEPDPKKDEIIKLEQKDVKIPQGKPIKLAEYKSSSFSQSEYLVYKESQARMRYMLLISYK